MIGLQPIGSISRYGNQSDNQRVQKVKIISVWRKRLERDGLTSILFCFMYRGGLDLIRGQYSVTEETVIVGFMVLSE